MSKAGVRNGKGYFLSLGKKNHRLQIVKIDMTKDFFDCKREITDDGISKDDYFVFGHYDYLRVSLLSPENENTFLDEIFRNAKISSTCNIGKQKHHILYAIDWKEREKDDKFWVDNDKDFFVISLIHLAPADGVDRFYLEHAEKLEEKISKQTAYSARVFVSLDCSDLMVFWKTTSLDIVAETVGALYENEEYLEFFSILSCKYALIREAYKKLNDAANKIKSSSSKKERINLYLRGQRFRDVKLAAKYICEMVEPKPDMRITAGEDDLVIPLQVDQVQDLFAIYGKILACKDEMNILCRTEIEAPYTGTFDVKNRDEEEVTVIRRNSKTKLCQELEGLAQNHPEVMHMPWYAPLCELFTEFSEIAQSNIADEIYYQSVNSLFHLTKLLSEITKTGRLFSDRTISVNLMQFIRGWSQLSFHAMHAQRQLNQTSEINRLYLFPAKMGLIYHCFMTDVSRLLASNENEYTSNHKCSYFLTPQVCDKAEFVSVFKSYSNASHLVLGTLPADDLFRPSVMLPILVHEAAHYSGTYPRNRSFRALVLRKAAVEFLIMTFVNGETWEKVFPDKKLRQEVVVQEIDWILSLLPPESEVMKLLDIPEQETQYSENIYPIILNQINSLFAEGNEVRSFARNIAESIYARENLSTLYRIVLAEGSIENVFEIVMAIWGDTRETLADYLHELLVICQESFSDLCMVILLGMNQAEYRNVIKAACSNYSLGDDEIARRSVRNAAITMVMYEEGAKGWKQLSSKAICDAKNTIDEKLYTCTATLLLEYLREAKNRLDSLVENQLLGAGNASRQTLVQLRELYRTLTVGGCSTNDQRMLEQLLKQSILCQNAVLFETKNNMQE